MNVRQWLWCLSCERCFEVFLSKDFDEGADWVELEMQLPVEGTGKELEGLHRYEDVANCPYEGCDGNPIVCRGINTREITRTHPKLLPWT